MTVHDEGQIAVIDRPDLPRVDCPSCGLPVPSGLYCGACGADMTTGSPSRVDAFAAAPGERVLAPAFISTLFPHMPARNSLPFRMTTVCGLVIVVGLGLVGLNGAAIAAAALLIPLLYLIYLYEVDVFGEESVAVISVVLGVGILVGLGWAWLTSHSLTETLAQGAINGLSVGDDLRYGVALPVAAQALMLATALILYPRRHYDEVLDGFASGVTAALGFTAAATIYNLWPELTHGTVSRSHTIDQALLLVGRGLLIPFISATATGLIAGVLWLGRNRTRTLDSFGWAKSPVVLVPIIAVMWACLGLVNLLVTSTPIVVAVYLVVALALLLIVRLALHNMLLAEAVDLRIGPDSVCFQCEHLVPRMAFCDNCGVATRATPKRGMGWSMRTFR